LPSPSTTRTRPMPSQIVQTAIATLIANLNLAEFKPGQIQA
jgi:hypothetical protein